MSELLYVSVEELEEAWQQDAAVIEREELQNTPIDPEFAGPTDHITDAPTPVQETADTYTSTLALPEAASDAVTTGLETAENAPTVTDTIRPARSVTKARVRRDNSPVPDATQQFHDAIRQIPLLSAEEEVELAKKIEVGVYAGQILSGEVVTSQEYTYADLGQLFVEGEEAKWQMVTANMGLAFTTANKYGKDKGDLEFLDVVHMGVEGLLRAVEKFDYTQGWKFSTYAMWQLRACVNRGLANESNTIRIADGVFHTLRSLKTTSGVMEAYLGRVPTDEELAEKLEKPVEKIREYKKLLQHNYSLERLIIHDDGEGEESGTALYMEGEAGPADFAEYQEGKLLLDDLFDCLNEQQTEMIKLVFGLDGYNDHSVSQAAQKLGLNMEAAKKVKSSALQKMRESGRAETLRDYIKG